MTTYAAKSQLADEAQVCATKKGAKINKQKEVKRAQGRTTVGETSLTATLIPAVSSALRAAD